MRLAALAGILALLTPLQAQAELALLYWPGAKVSAESRAELELILKDVAMQYAEKNETADLGPLDLLHSETNVKVHIWTEDADDPVYYLWGEIFCHISVAKKPAEFRQKMMHEFSHLYDYTMMDMLKAARRKKHPIDDFRIRKGRSKDPLLDYVRDNDANEARAKKRELGYMAGPGKMAPLPCSLHTKPNACVQSIDFRKAERPRNGNPRINSILDDVSRTGSTV